jgi:hypothetical protein
MKKPRTKIDESYATYNNQIHFSYIFVLPTISSMMKKHDNTKNTDKPELREYEAENYSVVCY